MFCDSVFRVSGCWFTWLVIYNDISEDVDVCFCIVHNSANTRAFKTKLSQFILVLVHMLSGKSEFADSTGTVSTGPYVFVPGKPPATRCSG